MKRKAKQVDFDHLRKLKAKKNVKPKGNTKRAKKETKGDADESGADNG